MQEEKCNLSNYCCEIWVELFVKYLGSKFTFVVY